MSSLRCAGCGTEVPGDSPTPFRCPNAGKDEGDHVVARTLAPSPAIRFPTRDAAPSPNPFVRYRALTHAYALATSRGMTDEAFVALVDELDRAVARVAGHGFAATPFARSPRLAESLGLAAPGGVFVKDETGNVGGSHKARHLMGLAILGEVQTRTGIVGPPYPRLAIASCGNAALAAAVVARAWGRALDVFIPVDANPRVVQELERLGAAIHVCPRSEGTPGDPCYHAFRAAVAEGALPFCCQGSDNGLTLEGGETLAWEMIDALGVVNGTLDRLFVQVGGGALASACIAGFRDAASLGVAVELPRIHAVQTRGAFPLRRAWEKVTGAIARRLGLDPGGADAAIAGAIRTRARSAAVAAVLEHAAKHRSQYMWPWEAEPKSVAHGILDDETYDWLAIVRGMIDSGGYPVVVGEERLVQANQLARKCTNIDVDPTGSAGLAGLLELSAGGEIELTETVGVLFTGVRR